MATQNIQGYDVISKLNSLILECHKNELVVKTQLNAIKRDLTKVKQTLEFIELYGGVVTDQMLEVQSNLYILRDEVKNELDSIRYKKGELEIALKVLNAM